MLVISSQHYNCYAANRATPKLSLTASSLQNILHSAATVLNPVLRYELTIPDVILLTGRPISRHGMNDGFILKLVNFSGRKTLKTGFSEVKTCEKMPLLIAKPKTSD